MGALKLSILDRGRTDAWRILVSLERGRVEYPRRQAKWSPMLDCLVPVAHSVIGLIAVEYPQGADQRVLRPWAGGWRERRNFSRQVLPLAALRATRTRRER